LSFLFNLVAQFYPRIIGSILSGIGGQSTPSRCGQGHWFFHNAVKSI
jgi:hypothetical protein